ncbi:MAG: hypothetical protein JW703_02440, partial [Candidatus Diapherotrites archaeon]|nr:hypothetical protein [Candidatus Diapherotrites archaeon]
MNEPIGLNILFSRKNNFYQFTVFFGLKRKNAIGFIEIKPNELNEKILARHFNKKLGYVDAKIILVSDKEKYCLLDFYPFGKKGTQEFAGKGFAQAIDLICMNKLKLEGHGSAEIIKDELTTFPGRKRMYSARESTHKESTTINFEINAIQKHLKEK